MTRAARIPGRRLLHSPGPTPLPDAVLHALAQQPMDLADPRVDANIAACEAGLRHVLQSTSAGVYFYAANGHGVWEAVVENLCAPGETVLVPGTGHFSESWAMQTEALGRKVLRTPWQEGWPINPDEVEQMLRDDREQTIRAVFAVHTDTATGVSSDLAALRAAIDAAGHPALLVADVVASLAASPFAMDELGVDLAVGASQKGLMCPPGVGFLAVNDRAFAVAARNPAPRFYWDFVRRRDALSYRKFCGTPPQNLMFGLEAALGLIADEGLPAVFERHALLARAVQAAVEGWGTVAAGQPALSLLAREAASRSVSVTAVAVHPDADLDVDALRTIARERFQVAMAGGLGPLAGRAFRIGHLGDCNPANILGAVAGIEAALRTQRVSIGDGIGRAVAVIAEG